MAEPRTLEPDEWDLWHTWMQAQRLLARELDRCLQRDHGISKAEFSVLVTVHRAEGGRLRVGELAESLDWEKSRVAHQLTRMEARGLVERVEAESSGRRIGIMLTASGRDAAEKAVVGHGANIRRLFFDNVTPDQAGALQAWSREAVERFEAP